MHKYSTNLGLYMKYPSYLVLGLKSPNSSKGNSFLAYVGLIPPIRTRPYMQKPNFTNFNVMNHEAQPLLFIQYEK